MRQYFQYLKQKIGQNREVFYIILFLSIVFFSYILYFKINIYGLLENLFATVITVFFSFTIFDYFSYKKILTRQKIVSQIKSLDVDMLLMEIVGSPLHRLQDKYSNKKHDYVDIDDELVKMTESVIKHNKITEDYFGNLKSSDWEIIKNNLVSTISKTERYLLLYQNYIEDETYGNFVQIRSFLDLLFNISDSIYILSKSGKYNPQPVMIDDYVRQLYEYMKYSKKLILTIKE